MQAPQPQLVKIGDIILDLESPSRAWIRRERVEDYARTYKDPEEGKKMPPLDLFTDNGGESYHIGDGIHRYTAAIAANLKKILAVVHEGGKAEADEFSLSANTRHGIPPDGKDRERGIRWLLAQPKYQEFSLRSLGKLAGCHMSVVDRIRKLVLDEEGRKEPETVLSTNGKRVAARKPIPEPEESSEREPGEDHGPAAEDSTARASSSPDASGHDTPENRPTYQGGTVKRMAPADDRPKEAIHERLLTDFRSMVSKIGRVMSMVNGTSESPGGERLASQRQSIRDGLKNAQSAIKFSAPYATCPVCAGQGCQPDEANPTAKTWCDGLGWITQLTYKSLTPELRDICDKNAKGSRHIRAYSLLHGVIR